MTPRPLSTDLPGLAIVDPVGALLLMAQIDEERLDLASFGASPSLALELPSRAMRSGSRLGERRMALIRATAALFDSPLRGAWLEGALAAGLDGSPERPSDIACVFSEPPRLPLSQASAERWVETGLLAFRSAQGLCAFDASLDAPLGAPLLERAFSRFLPRGPGRDFPGRFSSHEGDADILRAMINRAMFARLAPAYLAAGSEAFLNGLQALIDQDEDQASRAASPPSPDPAYAQILQWSRSRVEQGIDHLFIGAPYRRSDYASALARLVSDRSLPAFHALELDACVPPAPKASPRFAL